MLDARKIPLAFSMVSSRRRKDMPQLAVMLLSVGITTAPQPESSRCAEIAACGESNTNNQ